jgi:hypothetical protein
VAKIVGIVAAVAVTVLVGVAAQLELPKRQGSDSPVAAVPAFPAIDQSTLTPLQSRVADVLKSQRRAQPESATYTEGADEPWCADFVSWVMREAGAPLNNPNSGSWRITGVYTLQQYYESDATTITTVGGNEGGISVRRSALGPDEHLLGFGRLQ